MSRFFALAASSLSKVLLPKPAYCEENISTPNELPSLIEQADESRSKRMKKVKTPIQFESLKNLVGQATVGTYDGFRCQVSKGLNMNAQVSHFYWMGSQQAPPMYQYRLVLSQDDKLVNVATDCDFNIEGDIRFPITSNVSSKTKFLIGEQAQTLDIDFDITEASSAIQCKLSRSTQDILGITYMQALTASLAAGGQAEVDVTNGTLVKSVGAVYDDGPNVAAGTWDSELHLMYMRRVNPNRVHLSTELSVDKENNSSMTVGAEYMYKQGRLHMSVDSNLTIKSALDTNISPGMNLQLVAELSQLNQQAKFGTFLMMG